MKATAFSYRILLPVAFGVAVYLGLGSAPGVPRQVVEAPSGQERVRSSVETSTVGVSDCDASHDEAVGWQAELDRLDRSISQIEVRSLGTPGDWLGRSRLAGGLMARARLTGSYDDYARAEQVLADAMAVAPVGGGPLLNRSSLHFSLHRLPAAAADLEAAAALPPLIRPRPEVLLQRRGALALELGNYPEARRLLEESVALKPGMTNLSGLALWHWKTGDLDGAERLYDRAEDRYLGRPNEPRAWMDLQRGLLDLDRGRYPEALAHYRDAEHHLPGWYLVDEHIAEAVRLLGRREEARSIYLRVVASTGNPEFMDALADMAREDGDDAAAQDWVDRAHAAYEAQLDRFPEAASGHALGHFLDFGQAPGRALDIARQNHDNRPNVAAKALLAQAALEAGQLAEARQVVEDALANLGRSADLHAVAAEVYGALGEADAASQQQQLALRFNPRVLD